MRVDLARAHLRYGEWLPREPRRTDARTHVRNAYDTFKWIGPEAFAERCPSGAAGDGRAFAHADCRATQRSDDDLSVRLLDAAQRSDAELRGMVLQAIAWKTETPAELIHVEVDDGWVILKGTVNYQFESDAAYEDVANLFGVVGITNAIRVVTP